MTRQHSKQLLLCLALGLLVVTAGCSGGGDLGGAQVNDDGGDSKDDTAMATEAGASKADVDRESTVAPQELQVRQRAVIKTGRVKLLVADFESTSRNLTHAVQRYGGFVSDSRVDVHRVDNATYKTGELVLRVPRENFSEMLAHAKTVGRVESASTTSEDVTEQLVDINARLKNLRAERDRLRTLYQTANDTEEVLAVEKRLSEVQGEIERLEAKRKALRRQVALATIRIELREPRPDESLREDRKWYESSIGAAFVASVDGVATTLRALVVASAYALPYLLVFGLPLVGIGYGIRRRRRSSETTHDTSGSEDNDGRPEEATGGEQPDDSDDATADHDE